MGNQHTVKPRRALKNQGFIWCTAFLIYSLVTESSKKPLQLPITHLMKKMAAKMYFSTSNLIASLLLDDSKASLRQAIACRYMIYLSLPHHWSSSISSIQSKKSASGNRRRHRHFYCSVILHGLKMLASIYGREIADSFWFCLWCK